MPLELETPDKLEYQFNPVTSGALQFRVKAANDAHIALTTGPAEEDPMYEVFIGGWGNTKSVIRRNRTKPDKVEAETPNILSGDEYRGFWIRWSSGNITAGREGEAEPFLSWSDPEPFGIGYYGICTGWGASGAWIIEGAELKTADKLEYNFKPVLSGAIEIHVKSPSNAHIALTSGPRETEPMYEIILGGWENTASVIRYNRTKPDKVQQDTPQLLSPNEFRQFVIEWNNGVITASANGTVLLQWKDPNPFGVTHYGVRTAWGASGKWKLRSFDPRSSRVSRTPLPSAPPAVAPAQRPFGWDLAGGVGTDFIRAEMEWAQKAGPPGWNVPVGGSGSAVWVDARAGEVPPNAVPGGYDNEQLYVGRANHEGALIPGKVVPSHGVCYVAWGGMEHGKEEYQVLCECEVNWVPASGGAVPEGALPAGQTEDGEPLFVGRAQHEGTLTLGKVQPSHTVCYIPYGGQELAHPDYEVLVTK